MTDESPGHLWEHIRSLQAQIDHLRDLDEARLDRIQRLERDREVLRDRLEKATKRGRSRRGQTESRSDTTTSPFEKPSLEVPGVGLITEPDLPDFSPARDLRVGTVLDTFSTFAFSPEFRAVPLGALTWEEELADPPELLMVESAYLGHDGSWVNRIARFGEPSRHLKALIDWCRRRDIPTVFWNKEDPINFDWFIESARLFDVVFTVDGDQIPRYRAELGHDRVHLLQFFAQPRIHYPGSDENRTGTVAFAGSYYAAKHPARRAQIEMVLNPAREYGLHIFDRHGHSDDPRFAWPEKYRPHIMGSLTYLQTVEAYRRYKVFLNVNTVTNSPTMCARRVFELAASGTPIMTGPSRAIGHAIPAKTLREVATEAEVKEGISTLLGDSHLRLQLADQLRRHVLDHHCATHRVDAFFSLSRRL
ncbi:hypothetical protein BH23ACT5_BH23ACT5_01840 [soil metagenome]